MTLSKFTEISQRYVVNIMPVAVIAEVETITLIQNFLIEVVRGFQPDDGKNL